VDDLGIVAVQPATSLRRTPGTVMHMADEGVVVWYNPHCSKCQGADELLAAYGVPARRVLYLDDPPPPAEIVVGRPLSFSCHYSILARTRPSPDASAAGDGGMSLPRVSG
jgi:hypothetical protein